MDSIGDCTELQLLCEEFVSLAIRGGGDGLQNHAGLCMLELVSNMSRAKNRTYEVYDGEILLLSDGNAQS